MPSDTTSIHLLAGGVGGTVGAVITCPLEVVKTRLQSSYNPFHDSKVFVTNISYNRGTHQSTPLTSANFTTCASTSTCSRPVTAVSQAQPATTRTFGLYSCLKHIVQKEGPRALFRGLGPNLIGVAPSRAIYFYTYAQAKSFFNSVMSPETPIVHICSAACAGFTASTTTNPIWFIKTRLQIDQKKASRRHTLQCIKDIYKENGLRGFYKGVTASYYGISETVIHFVIYEAIKAELREIKARDGIMDDEKFAIDFVEFMAAGATSKTIATFVAYPHEVARTRLREEGNKYHGFWQTLGLVAKEEGVHGLYRGLVTQLVRQIPNTAIMLSTYEAVVYLCSKHL